MNNPSASVFTKVPIKVWMLFIAVFFLMAIPFFAGLEHMLGRWIVKEEYSHGFFLPIIALYLLWERRHILARLKYTGSYWGLVLVIVGLLLSIVGEFATIYEVITYGFVIALWGVVLAITGFHSFRYFFVPLLILFLMIPLPNFIYHNLSAQLQLISSQIGVAVIRLFDIPVYLEGNVIDLGSMKLQVVEACSGLRYLFPLMTLGFILGYMFNAPFFFRLMVFISTVPITILMNSFRIGLIGVTVEYWGQKAAEGVLHDFEGWVVFMSSLVVLLAEIWLLARLLGDKRPLSELLSTSGAFVPSHEGDRQSIRQNSDAIELLSLRKPFYSSVLAILLLTVVALLVPQRTDVVPERRSFALFPLRLDDWVGVKDYLAPKYLRTLKLSDYILADYHQKNDNPVNFYVSYYDTQKKGRSAHSPKSCIPGDGWEINEFSKITVDLTHYHEIPVNRAIISKGTNKTLVYYWFQQRGRFITNEYFVKGYLLVDALLDGRTDGAMIRLTAPVPKYGNVKSVDERLQNFMSVLYPELNQYIPD